MWVIVDSKGGFIRSSIRITWFDLALERPVLWILSQGCVQSSLESSFPVTLVSFTATLFYFLPRFELHLTVRSMRKVDEIGF